MKSSLLKLALAALIVGAPVALHAQTDTTNPIATTPVKNPAPATASTKTKTKKTPYSGTVKSIDATSLVVTTSKGDVTLTLAPTTKVKVDKKPAKVTDITTGEKVTGSYTTDASGTLTAYSIHGSTK